MTTTVADTIDDSTSSDAPTQLQSTQSVDLPSILTSIANANYNLQGNISQVQNNNASAQDIFASTVNTLQNVSSAVEQVTTAQETAKSQAINSGIKLIQDMGVSPDVKIALAQEAGLDYQNAMTALDNIHQKESVNFWDDPVSWIGNQLTIGNDYQDYNNAVDKHNLAEGRLTELNTLSQETMKTSLAMTAADNAETISNLATIQSAKYSVQADQSKIEALRFNTQTLGEVSQMSQEQLSNQEKAASLITTQQELEMRKQQFGLEQQNLALRAKELQATLDMRNLTLEEKQKKDADANALLQDINSGRRMVSKPPYQNAAAMLRDYTANNQVGNITRAYAESGAYQRTQGARVFAPDLNSSVELALADNVTGTEGGNAPLFKFIQDTKNSYLNSNPQAATLKPKQLADAVTNNVKINLDNQQAAIKYGTGNLFQAPDAQNLLKAAPALQELPFTQVVLNPVIATKGSENPTDLINLGIAAVNKGLLTQEQLSNGIASYYNAGMQVNAGIKDFNAIGYATPKAYNAKLDLPGVFSAVDLTNQVRVSSMINSQMTLAKFREAIIPFSGAGM